MTTKRYTGTIYWNPGEDDEASGDVPIALLRPGEIAIEIIYDNRKYDARLTQRGDIMTGRWSTRDPDSGQLSCIAVQKGDEIQLSGDWHEDGKDYKFRADLQLDED